MPKVKHIAMRSCVACGQKLPKRELLRIVRSPEGHVSLDPTGKKAGRGAYLCRNKDCWKKALKSDRLEHALRDTIAPGDLEELKPTLSGGIK